MVNALAQQSAGYTDAKGFKGRVKYFVSYDNDGDGVSVSGAFVTALSACTNAVLSSAPGIGGELTISGSYGTNATYANITDVLVLEAIDSAGSIHRFSIPAPKAALFLADQVAADFSNTDLAALVNVIVNGDDNPYFISTRSGLQFSSVPVGSRVRKRNRKRITGFTKNGALSGPAQ